MVVALAGYTGMDVASILPEMRVEVEGFAQTHPHLQGKGFCRARILIKSANTEKLMADPKFF